MSAPFEIPVTTAGMLAAVACVVAGGPLFADGLRALRQRRLLAALRPTVPGDVGAGPVHATGHVALESPLFSPLSMRPCAGYALEVHARESAATGCVRVQRGFKLAGEHAEAFVAAEGGVWTLPVTAEREIAAGEDVSANLAALLDREPTLAWMREHRAPMRVVERSLQAGAPVAVVGVARTAAAAEAAQVRVLAATGTDGEAWEVVETAPAGRPSLRIEAGDALELHVLGEGAAAPQALAPARWRTFGAVLGPVLSLAGLLYLAHAADATLVGRF